MIIPSPTNAPAGKPHTNFAHIFFIVSTFFLSIYYSSMGAAAHYPPDDI